MTQADIATNGSARGDRDLDALLADPATRAKLAALVERLDVLQFGLDAADGLMRRGEDLVENIAEGVLEAKEHVDPETILAMGRLVALTPQVVSGLERLAPALESEGLSQLGDPALVDSLAKLSDKIPMLLFAAEAAEGFLQRGEVLVENVAEGVREARDITSKHASGTLATLSQLSSLLPAVQRLLLQVQPFLESGSLERLFQSKILAPEMIDTVARLGDALHATRERTDKDPVSVGLFGAMRALSDPDAKRALGFFTTFLKEFGRQMR